MEVFCRLFGDITSAFVTINFLELRSPLKKLNYFSKPGGSSEFSSHLSRFVDVCLRPPQGPSENAVPEAEHRRAF
jgi:hypothetical protein